jgi:hypothetical protein
MKKLFYLLPLLSFLCFASCQDTKTTSGELITEASFNEEAELAAIMKVIENETACFFARDYDCWKDNWVNEDYAFQAWNNPDGTYDAKVGWSEVDRRTGNFIKENAVTIGGTQGHPNVERLNLRKRFYGNSVAHLTWEQYNSDDEEQAYQISQEVRLMEKVDGEWKIVTVAAFWDYVDEIQAGTFETK